MKKSGAIAILAHQRTGSRLLKEVITACGMKNCNQEIGVELGDINEIGTRVYNNFPVDGDPVEIVSNVLKHFKTQAELAGWEHYGIKVEHSLQHACWDVIGKQFGIHWPDARYVISLRRPAGILRSVEKLKKENAGRLDPHYPPLETINSYLSTYDAIKHLLEEREAVVVVYPDSYHNGGIKKVIGALGLTWTKKAAKIFKSDTQIVSEGMFSDYSRAVDMFEELKEYAK